MIRKLLIFLGGATLGGSFSLFVCIVISMQNDALTISSLVQIVMAASLFFGLAACFYPRFFENWLFRIVRFFVGS